jgi:hypothetical protein
VNAARMRIDASAWPTDDDFARFADDILLAVLTC